VQASKPATPNPANRGKYFQYLIRNPVSDEKPADFSKFFSALIFATLPANKIVSHAGPEIHIIFRCIAMGGRAGLMSPPKSLTKTSHKDQSWKRIICRSAWDDRKRQRRAERVKNLSYRHHDGEPEMKGSRIIRDGSRLFVVTLLLLQINGARIGFAASESIGEPASTRAEPKSESDLPVVFLEANEAIVSERRVPCSFRMVLDAASAVTNSLPGGVRIHGASSRVFPKKSFGVALDSPVSLLGMRQRMHWILNAAYIDRSLMRHKLSYDLFRSLSTPGSRRFAVASRFVEVNLNGRYNGAYLLMERVDAQLLELRPYQSNTVSHACIYKAADHAANFTQPGHGGFEQREPDPLLQLFWKPLDQFNRFASSTPDAEFFDPLTGIASRLDLENAIDFHLLLLLTSNMDGNDKNFILARDEPSAGTPKARFFFAPWDYDATFGRNWNATVVRPSAWLSNHLFDRLLGNSEYREKFMARWNQLHSGAFSVKTIHGLIDANARALGKAVQRNAARWPTRRGYYPDDADWAKDIADMKSWSEARVSWLDQDLRQRFNNH
jgi:hypothetical protein